MRKTSVQFTVGGAILGLVILGSIKKNPDEKAMMRKLVSNTLLASALGTASRFLPF